MRLKILITFKKRKVLTTSDLVHFIKEEAKDRELFPQVQFRIII